ncbi:hypothetical protein LA332_23740 [Leclercia adecarboxylata]|nr:hypothetical protein LA332_23740 [Leclercia adecarboxylata]
MKRKTTVHYLVSPPRKLKQTRDKLKLKVHCFTRLEVATRRNVVCFFCMSRAPRFIPTRQGKCKI